MTSLLHHSLGHDPLARRLLAFACGDPGVNSFKQQLSLGLKLPESLSPLRKLPHPAACYPGEIGTNDTQAVSRRSSMNLPEVTAGRRLAKRFQPNDFTVGLLDRINPSFKGID